MLHQVNALVLEDVANCVSGLSAYFYPIEGTVEIQIYCGRIGVWIVSTNLFSKFTITWCAYVSNNDAIDSIALARTPRCNLIFVAIFFCFLFNEV